MAETGPNAMGADVTYAPQTADTYSNRNIQMRDQAQAHFGPRFGDVHHHYSASRQSEEWMENKRREIIKWLSPVDFAVDQENAARNHEDRTGEWFTKGVRYSKWREEPNSFMWLYGIPGSGKTVLS